MPLSKSAGIALAAFVVGLGASRSLGQRKPASHAKVEPIGATNESAGTWADRTLKSLTLEEKIGQMIEVRGIMGFYNSDDPVFTKLISDIKKYHLGGVHLSVNTDGPLLIRTEPYEAAMTTRLLQKETHGKVPLIFSVDLPCG